MTRLFPLLLTLLACSPSLPPPAEEVTAAQACTATPPGQSAYDWDQHRCCVGRLTDPRELGEARDAACRRVGGVYDWGRGVCCEATDDREE